MSIMYAQRFILMPDNIHSNKINLELYEYDTRLSLLSLAEKQTFGAAVAPLMGFLSVYLKRSKR